MAGLVRSRVLRWTIPAVGAALVVFAPGAAFAGSGLETNFPEQPGSNMAQACESILSNPDRALNFITGEQHMSQQAEAILVPMYVDACLGG